MADQANSILIYKHIIINHIIHMIIQAYHVRLNKFM